MQLCNNALLLHETDRFIGFYEGIHARSVFIVTQTSSSCISLYPPQERHLQDVIQAKQTNSVKKKHVYIPIPEATIPVKHYDTINQQINRAHQYVRVPGKIHCLIYCSNSIYS